MLVLTDLKITEIFYSLQGETSSTGWPTVFIRLTGCPLRCSYCDTAYAFHGGERWVIADVLAHIQRYATRFVTVTGGEPLAQPGCLSLLTQLCDTGYRVSLETSGAMPVKDVDPRVIKILDVKTPSSGEHGKQLWENFEACAPHDEIKFVIGDRADYGYACEVMREHDLGRRFQVLFSPVHGRCDLKDLSAWVLADQLPVRVQCQLHKVIWGEKPGC